MLSSVDQRAPQLQTLNFAAVLSKPVKQAQLEKTLVGVFSRLQVAVKPAPAGAQFDATLAQRRPLRILLAEDNVVNQKVALQILARLGYRADVVANGLEVLEAVQRQSYDVILMDVQMPEMDGLEATRQLCSVWSGDKRPYIIAMTAYALMGDAEKCLAAGMNDYLSKPIHVDKLVEALSNCRTKATPERSPV
jgi:CheY-like chemotaxis protein